MRRVVIVDIERLEPPIVVHHALYIRDTVFPQNLHEATDGRVFGDDLVAKVSLEPMYVGAGRSFPIFHISKKIAKSFAVVRMSANQTLV